GHCRGRNPGNARATGAWLWTSGYPAVLIVQSNDIVFAEIFAALHFNQDQIDQSRVAQTMPVPGRYECGLVGIHQTGCIRAIQYLGHALDHDPVFTAVVVHLQRQGCAGLDQNTFDLESGPLFEHRVAAPWATDRAMMLIGGMLLMLEPFGYPADILSAIGAGYQNRIGRVHDDQVVYSDGGNQSVVAEYEGVAGVFHYHVADDPVALLVRGDQVGEGVPRAYVAPVEPGGGHGDPIGSLHQGIVDGYFRQLAEADLLQLLQQHAGTVMRRAP